MDIVSQLQRQYVDFMSSIYREGLLNDQFLMLQKFQDERDPQFVNEVVSHFFENSERHLRNLTVALDQQPVDYTKVNTYVHQCKSSSSSVGAQRMSNICISLKTCYEARNLEGCIRSLQQLKDEYNLVKNKLQTLFRLEQQIVAVGGVIPILG
ncbi:histidine-containing phosphotransfer protein 1-like [Apium graveolens]|uniref:histidine-containing phosphotransfer protein 1-like n=1 Tax=Apium graveolens TaxID=4045 RepID=UPI003D7BFB72